MRAKRSKKYRKVMHQYELTFGFHEPYQVLVDSNFLSAVHTFKMDLIPALERTLQGQVKPFLTKCSLAAVNASQPINPKTNAPYRPTHLPPPTTLPLRHCSHSEDSTPIDENSCLLSLFSPSRDSKKNKEHYILATAEPPSPEKVAAKVSGDGKARRRAEMDAEEAVRRARALRSGTRAIPGVPIVYVKRSVMVLEPLSRPSEGVRDGFEQGKFRAGLDSDPALGKRKREEEAEGEAKKEKKKKSKTKGPNPLSMKKPKKREDDKEKEPRKEGAQKPAPRGDGDDAPEQNDGDNAPKPKRRRRHHKGMKGENDGDGEPSNGAEGATALTDSME